MTVRATAYSPHDPHDSHYRATKGKWINITADGRTDVRHVQHGMAVPLVPGRRRPIIAYGTLITIPDEYGYPVPQVRVDDTGSGIRKKTAQTGVTYVDLRFPKSADALAWTGPKGYRELRIFIHQ
jgi:3D (Asp-Asp-Asp) domain-containing protein